MFRKSILFVVSLVGLMFTIVLFVSVQQAKNIRRDPAVLMNKYYQLKKTNPAIAQQALLILLAQTNSYPPALQEARLLSLHHQNVDDALSLTQCLKTGLLIHGKHELQLAYLDYKVGQWWPTKSSASLIRSEIPAAPQEIPRSVDSLEGLHPVILSNTRDDYIQLDPNRSRAQLAGDHDLPAVYRLKKAGYLSIRQHRPYAAIDYFSQAYRLTHEPDIAMQLGYLSETVKNPPDAYKYFQDAARSKDKALALQAETAMTNLSGLQTKALPEPYFSEVFFNPFSESRFGLTVRPLIIRLGVEQNNTLHTRQYIFFRRTDDNKSENLGQLPQIYEDNVQITGMGGQITPIKGLPLVGFLEAGAAYDLVYRNRDRWRGDFRGGLMYYNEFCARPAYFDKLTFSTNYYSDLYGEAIYFTRYANVIAGVKTHQGIRLLQYHSSMINVYATARAITDTQRLFFNNLAEVGPGIEFIPTNRVNVKIRFEHVNGVYIPAGSIPNPYDHYYTNNLVQLLVYVKI